jgi:hypothetical protein
VTADNRDSVPNEAHQALYEPGDPVWVGRSRGSEREGTILRLFGDGYYGASIAAGKGQGLCMRVCFSRAEKMKRAEVPDLFAQVLRRR